MISIMEFHNTRELMWMYNYDVNQSILWNSIHTKKKYKNVTEAHRENQGAVSERSE